MGEAFAFEIFVLQQIVTKGLILTGPCKKISLRSLCRICKKVNATRHYYHVQAWAPVLMWPVCLHPSATTTALPLPRATVARRLQWRPPLLPASRLLASALLPRLLTFQSAARASPLFAQPSTSLSLAPHTLSAFTLLHGYSQMLGFSLFLGGWSSVCISNWN